MRKTLYLVLLLLVFLSVSCDFDQCEQTITYTKATAIFADLDEVRIDDFIESPRQIENPGKIYVDDELLIIGERGVGIHIIDNSDPANPVPFKFLNIPGVYELFVRDGYIYANAFYDLLKMDIKVIEDIRLSSRLKEAFPVTVKDPEGKALIGFNREKVTEQGGCDYNLVDGEIYYYDDRGVLLDESAIPTSFVSNGTTIGTANRMAFIDDHLFIIDHYFMHYFDAGGDMLKHNSSFSRDYYVGSNLETIYAMNDVLFVGEQNGMSMHRVASDAIEFISMFAHATGCDPVLPLTEGIAYLTLRSGEECPGDINSLNVVNIANLNNPFLIEEIPMLSPYGIALIDDRLYVGEGANGLTIFDASDRQRLRLIETISTLTAYDVMVHPRYRDIILTASAEGLAQYRLDDRGLGQVSFISF